jgi:hypothetical protein
MPTLLPPRASAPNQRDEFSPALVVTISVLALLLVMAEAQALAGWNWVARLPDGLDMILPM